MLYKDGEKYFTQAPEVVNDLTTGGTTKALSAEQGKVLKNTIDNLPQGGHTIKNDSGTSQTQRDNLQFGGVYTHDDSTNGKTQVDIVREFESPSAVEALTGEAAKGFQHTPDTVYRGRTASDIGFDKTGTSFNSTRVQDVLEEVDGRLNGIVYTGDLNDLKTTGFYEHTITSNSNAPSDISTDSICTLIVNASGSSLVTQILYYSNIAVYVRRFYSNSWNAWVKYSPNNSAWTRLGTVTTTTPLNIGSYGSFLVVPKVNGAIPFNSYIIPRLLLSYFHLSVYQNANANWHGILNINSNNELTLQQESLGSSWNSMTIDVLVR